MNGKQQPEESVRHRFSVRWVFQELWQVEFLPSGFWALETRETFVPGDQQAYYTVLEVSRNERANESRTTGYFPIRSISSQRTAVECVFQSLEGLENLSCA